MLWADLLFIKLITAFHCNEIIKAYMSIIHACTLRDLLLSTNGQNTEIQHSERAGRFTTCLSARTAKNTEIHYVI